MEPWNRGDAVPVVLFEVLLSICVLYGNTLVLLVLFRAKLIKNQQSAFIVLLSASDILRSLFTFIVAIAKVANPGIMGIPEACALWGFLLTFTRIANCMGTPLLIVDRLIFVSGPVNYKHRMTYKLILLMAVYTIFHALLVSCLALIGWGSYSNTALTCDVTWEVGSGHAILTLVWGYALPLVMTGLGLWRVRTTVLRRLNQIRTYSTLRPLGLHGCINKFSITEADLSFLYTVKILMIMAAVYYVSWLPYFIFSLVRIIMGTDRHYPVVVVVIVYSVTLVTSVINPWLYGLHNTRFRTAMKYLITCGKIDQSAILDLATDVAPSNASVEVDEVNVVDNTLSTAAQIERAQNITGTDHVYIAVKKVWQ